MMTIPEFKKMLIICGVTSSASVTPVDPYIATRAEITGDRGLGKPLYIVPPEGFTYSGVQFYRDGEPIDGANFSPYVQTAADVPSSGQTIEITAEIDGLMLVTEPFTITG